MKHLQMLEMCSGTFSSSFFRQFVQTVEEIVSVSAFLPGWVLSVIHFALNLHESQVTNEQENGQAGI